MTVVGSFLQDFRYMATSDLIEMLKDPVAWKQDADTERKLCDQIVSQLDDSSSDVSSLAVKWCESSCQFLQPASLIHPLSQPASELAICIQP